MEKSEQQLMGGVKEVALGSEEVAEDELPTDIEIKMHGRNGLYALNTEMTDFARLTGALWSKSLLLAV